MRGTDSKGQSGVMAAALENGGLGGRQTSPGAVLALTLYMAP